MQQWFFENESKMNFENLWLVKLLVDYTSTIATPSNLTLKAIKAINVSYCHEKSRENSYSTRAGSNSM